MNPSDNTTEDPLDSSSKDALENAPENPLDISSKHPLKHYYPLTVHILLNIL